MIYEVHTNSGVTYITSSTDDLSFVSFVYSGNVNLNVKSSPVYTLGDPQPYIISGTRTIYDSSLSADVNQCFTEIVSIEPRPDLVPYRHLVFSDYLLIGVLVLCILSLILSKH
jgi:hypothetical protein